MAELNDELFELQPEGVARPRASLLLVRCRIIGEVKSDGQAPRHQSIVMSYLLRSLSRSLTVPDMIVQINESDVLIVLFSRGVNVAAALIREYVAEIRSKLLGNGPPQEKFTAETMTIRSGGGVETREIASIDEVGESAELAAHRRQDPAHVANNGASMSLDPGPLRYSFTPVRDLRSKAITTYFLRCHGDKAGVGERRDYGILHGGESSPLVSSLDIQVLKRAEAELTAFDGQPIPFMLVWTIHVQTIGNSAQFQRYARRLASLAAVARHRIMIEIVGLRPDWPMSRIQAAVGVLRQYVRFVAIRQKVNSEILSVLRECGASTVSVSLKGDQDEVQLLPQLSAFCESAGRHGLVTVAQQIPTRSIAGMAAGAGFDHLHVDYLHEQQAKPSPASRFSIAELFALAA